jgi:hypothetical protein
MPELTITSPNVGSRVDSNTCTMGNTVPKSTLNLCPSQLSPRHGLRTWPLNFYLHYNICQRQKPQTNHLMGFTLRINLGKQVFTAFYFRIALTSQPKQDLMARQNRQGFPTSCRVPAFFSAESIMRNIFVY